MFIIKVDNLIEKREECINKVASSYPPQYNFSLSQNDRNKCLTLFFISEEFFEFIFYARKRFNEDLRYPVMECV